ncbi:hypothetical protein CXB51_000098 [Gossypium anomalum]|uniref:Integrase catalytic domain-containing protein n=1 Tax=Gossypium anomalum TaxID=47600 RepID=A0A8J5Z4D7_9ROSI|nr:hypothetical protein CXB51_000098 [Gossypium anomalum]
MPAYRQPPSARGRGRGRAFGSRFQCQLYGKQGHLVDRCYYRFDASYKNAGCRPPQSSQANVCMFGATMPWSNPFATPACSPVNTSSLAAHQPQAYIATPEAVEDNTWYPDSGATHHLIHLPTSLAESTPYKGPGKVYVGNGDALSVLSSGQSSLLTCLRPLLMRSLLLVPGITKNLLSVSKFTKDNQVIFEFLSSQCQIRDMHTGEVLLKGSEQHGLYKLHLTESGASNSSGSAQGLLATSIVPFDVWHCRLEHPCTNILTKALRKCNIPLGVNKSPFHCIACHLGKEHKQPFQKSTTEYTAPLQLVLADVWGPAPVSSNNFRYHVAFTDAYTRYTWLYFLKTKSEVLRVFPHFQSQAERVNGHKLKTLQTDGSGEFQALKRYLALQGIVHRLTCPYTSAQNGLVERKHKQIVETGLSMLAHASIPLVYWSDTFASVVYLFNRLPSHPLNHASPHEKLFKTTPNYNFLRVFGCLCFPNLRPYNNHKLQFRSTPCTFLGYSSSHKRYRCLDSFGKSSSKLLVLSPTLCAQMSNHSPTTSVPSHKSSPLSPISSPHLPPQYTNPSISSSSSSISPQVNSIPDPPTSSPISSNTHPMVTRSKAGVFKLKAYVTVEPSSISDVLTDIHAAISHDSWKAAVYTNRRAVGCKWLFKVKTRADGTVERYKALLVTKGFSQNAGLDYQDTFSPVVRATTIRTVLAISIMKNWSLRQLGFRAAKTDLSLFIRAASDSILLLMVYVDDTVLTGSSTSEIDRVVQLLHTKFALKDMEPFNFFLGITIGRSSKGLVLSQQKYVREILAQTGMSTLAPTSTPMKLVGKLQYLCITRPDLAYCVNKLSQFMNAPREFQLTCYSDVDWVTSVEDRRSTTGYVVYLSSNPIAWCSKKQAVVSRSTFEEKYKSFANCVSELLWIKQLLGEVGVITCQTPVIWCDNTSTVSMAANPTHHAKVKHVEIDHHFVREKVLDGTLQVNYVPSDKQIADALTKPIMPKTFGSVRQALCVLSNDTASALKEQEKKPGEC